MSDETKKPVTYAHKFVSDGSGKIWCEYCGVFAPLSANHYTVCGCPLNPALKAERMAQAMAAAQAVIQEASKPKKKTIALELTGDLFAIHDLEKKVLDIIAHAARSNRVRVVSAQDIPGDK